MTAERHRQKDNKNNVINLPTLPTIQVFAELPFLPLNLGDIIRISFQVAPTDREIQEIAYKITIRTMKTISIESLGKEGKTIVIRVH